jgi:hypothetical protein
MVSEKNEKRVDILQRAMTSVCFLAVLGSCGVLGFYVVVWGRGDESRLQVMPRVHGLSADEVAYLDDVRVFTGKDVNEDVGEESDDVIADSLLADSVQVADGVVATDSTAELVPAPVSVVVEKKKERSGRNIVKKGVVVEEEGIVGARSALANNDYDKVLQLLQNVVPSKEVYYLRAKAVMALYVKGQKSGMDVLSAWSRVREKSVYGSRAYEEADSILTLFK